VLDAWIETWLSPGFASWTLAEVLPRVTCPVLAIHGVNDEYGSVRHAELIGERSGGPARIEILEGIGHVPHREQPERVLGLVSGFLGG
jgi:pimeloyl-ACP methyl ester carboxylesterase